MKYFVANWKAHKDLESARVWCEDFTALIQSSEHVSQTISSGAIKVVVCPPHPLLTVVKEGLSSIPELSIGAQDVSEKSEGGYTGEVEAEELVKIASYVIVGHSERRQKLGETNEQVAAKIEQAKEAGLKTILCVRNGEDFLPGADFIAFEPVSAVGTGHIAPLSEILEMKKTLGLPPEIPYFYGGSVTPEVVSTYLAAPQIAGFLVGGASLDPKEFFGLLEKV